MDQAAGGRTVIWLAALFSCQTPPAAFDPSIPNVSPDPLPEGIAVIRAYPYTPDGFRPPAEEVLLLIDLVVASAPADTVSLVDITEPFGAPQFVMAAAVHYTIRVPGSTDVSPALLVARLTPDGHAMDAVEPRFLDSRRLAFLALVPAGTASIELWETREDPNGQRVAGPVPVSPDGYHLPRPRVEVSAHTTSPADGAESGDRHLVQVRAFDWTDRMNPGNDVLHGVWEGFHVLSAIAFFGAEGTDALLGTYALSPLPFGCGSAAAVVEDWVTVRPTSPPPIVPEQDLLIAYRCPAGTSLTSGGSNLPVQGEISPALLTPLQQRLATPSLRTRPFESVDLTADGALAVRERVNEQTLERGAIETYDAAAPIAGRPIDGATEMPSRLVGSEGWFDGRRVAPFSRDAKAFDLRTGERRSLAFPIDSDAGRPAVAPDGTRVLVPFSGLDGTKVRVELRSLPDGALLASTAAPAKEGGGPPLHGAGFAWSPGGRYFVSCINDELSVRSGSDGSSVTTWRPDGWAGRGEGWDPMPDVVRCAVSDDGATIAILADGRLEFRTAGGDRQVADAAALSVVALDGRHFATRERNVVRVWGSAGTFLRQFDGFAFRAVLPFTDGRMALVGEQTLSVVNWETADVLATHTYARSPGFVRASSDGSTFLIPEPWGPSEAPTGTWWRVWHPFTGSP